MIAVMLIALTIYAGIALGKDGPQFDDVKVFNSQLFPDAIGFAVYTFEGIGVILPIMEVTENKENYYKVLCVTISILALFYVVWTELMVVAWGNQLTTPLITDQLP